MMIQRSRFLIRGTLLLTMGFLLLAHSGADASPDPLVNYKSQVPAWEACDPGAMSDDYKAMLTLFGERARRAVIKVPLDYADPRGDIEVALLKVAAGNPQRRRGAILINPGGPGEDGLPYSLLFGYLWGEANPATGTGAGKLFREIAQYYDLVGFSPRGTGSSTQLRCISAESLKPATTSPRRRSGKYPEICSFPPEGEMHEQSVDALYQIDACRDMDIHTVRVGDDN